MSLRINHNIAALNGHRNMIRNDAAVSKSLERLSSGLRINRAADDAAGLVISEQMRAQITGLNQAIDNSETAITMVQTTEGALDEVNNLLNKARALVLHAANEGTNDLAQLQADQSELDNIIGAIDRIASFAQFGTKKLLDGSLDGVSSPTSGLSQIRAGNLTSNPAIDPGLVQISVTAGAREANRLGGGNTDDSDAYIFDTATVTGVLVTAGVSVRSGVTASLDIDGIVINLALTTTTTATGVADAFNQQLASNGQPYTVSVDATNGGFTVERTTLGDTNFSASISLSRPATPSASGSPETVIASVTPTIGSSAQAANAIFTGAISDLSAVTGTTTVSTSSVFTVSIGTITGGSIQVSVSGSAGTGTATTFSGGSTVSTVLTRLQNLINGNGSAVALSMSAATLSLGGGITSGFQVSLARGDATNGTDFNFALEIDYNNTPSQADHVVALAVNGLATVTSPAANATFIDSAAAGAPLSLSALASATGTAATVELAAGAALALNLDGNTFVVSGGAGVNLDAIASTLSAAFSGFTVSFLTGGEAMPGNASGVMTGYGFVAVNASGQAFGMSLSIDQIAGVDVDSATTSTVQTGTVGIATMNLDTLSQTRIDSSPTVTGHTALTLVNSPGAVVNTAGSQPTATLTSVNGVTLGLEVANQTVSGLITLGLDSDDPATVGYAGFSVEISDALALNGGVESFILDRGAVFQVGSNVDQLVSLTVSSTRAQDLARGVGTTVGITSLASLHSSDTAALINGHTNDALRVIDAAIDEVTVLRGELGAVQSNTLESGLSSLRVALENLTNAESTIRDVDFAGESAEFTKNNILMQSATAMLAQANQLPQNVLQLLQ